jgi:hypothetical protein
MDAPGDEVQQILRYLEGDHLTFEETSPGTFLVRSDEPGVFAHEPVLNLPRDLLTAYLEESRRLYLYAADPYTEALSMTGVHLSAALGTDHVDGVNWVIATGIRPGPDGRPELFVDQDPPPPEPHDPDDGPYEWTAERPPWS